MHMKYILLTGSFLFGIAGICQAMGVLMGERAWQAGRSPVVFNLQYVTLSFQPTPGCVKVLLLSLGFFCLFLIRQKLKKLGLGKIREYIPG